MWSPYLAPLRTKVSTRLLKCENILMRIEKRTISQCTHIMSSNSVYCHSSIFFYCTKHLNHWMRVLVFSGLRQFTRSLDFSSITTWSELSNATATSVVRYEELLGLPKDKRAGAKNSIIDRGQLRIHAARNLKKTRARSHKNEKMRERYEAKAVMEMLQQCWKGSSSCSEANQYRKAFSNKWKVEWTSSTPRVVFDDPSGFIPPYWAKTSGKADETDAAEFDAIGDTVLPLAVGRDVAEDPAAFMRIAEADNDATEMTGGAVGAAAEAEASDEPDLETATEVAEETEEEQIVLPAAGDRMETEELAREAEAADREAEAAGGSPSLPPTHAPTARGLPAPTPTAKPAPKPTRRGNKAGRKQQGQAHRGQPARRRSARSSGSELR